MSSSTGHSKKDRQEFNVYHRRDSVAIAGAEFQNVLLNNLADLRSIWDEVGMSEDQRHDRMSTALNHLKTLLGEMVDEENTMRETLHESVAADRIEVDILLKLLRRQKPEFMNGRDNCTLLQLGEKLRTLKAELTEEREARLQRRDELLAQYDVYAHHLAIAHREFDTDIIPEPAALDNLERDVAHLKKKWDTNLSVYQVKRVNIIRMASKVAIDGNVASVFQRDVLNGVDIGRDPSAVISDQHMIELSNLEKSVGQKYDDFIAAIRQRVGGAKADLVHWWDQCHVPQSERDRFETVDPELDPETAMAQYQDAVNQWRAFYESRKAILDKVGEWETLWNEQVEFEERERDVNRLNNRGGALLAEEKRRKKVQQLLPQAYKVLSDMVADYDIEHPETPFLLGSVPLMDHVDRIQVEYQEKKRKEKEEKELLKKQQIQNERIFGASSAQNTPGFQKKRLLSANAGTGPVSPARKGLAASQSKAYIHSSLANLRSPGAKQPPASAAATSRKPPIGVQTHKRKILTDEKNAPAQPNHGDAHAAGDDQPTMSSMASYGEFANAVRSKGIDGQSSFIAGQSQGGRSPQKMTRLN